MPQAFSAEFIQSASLWPCTGKASPACYALKYCLDLLMNIMPAIRYMPSLLLVVISFGALLPAQIACAQSDASSVQSVGDVSQSGSFSMQKAVVKKLYHAKTADALFVAYVVDWRGQEVVVSALDPSVRHVYKVGDEVSFIVQTVKPDSKSPGMLMFMLIPPSSP